MRVHDGHCVGDKRGSNRPGEPQVCVLDEGLVLPCRASHIE